MTVLQGQYPREVWARPTLGSEDKMLKEQRVTPLVATVQGPEPAPCGSLPCGRREERSMWCMV